MNQKKGDFKIGLSKKEKGLEPNTVETILTIVVVPTQIQRGTYGPSDYTTHLETLRLDSSDSVVSSRELRDPDWFYCLRGV